MRRLLDNFTSETGQFLGLTVLLFAIYAVLNGVGHLSPVNVVIVICFFAALYGLAILCRLIGIGAQGPD